MSADAAKKRGGCGRVLLILGVVLLVGAVAAAVGGYFYWLNFQKSPAYSLALLIDAARKDDKPQVEQFLDTNAVVDDFVPQVVAKATERYGRGFPPQIVAKATQILQPLLPAVKDAARQKIPQIIRDKAQTVPNRPAWQIALGVGQYAKIEQTADTATVKTDVEGSEVSLTMRRDGNRWKVVGLHDDKLADKIAEDVAQKVLAVAAQKQKGGAGANKETVEQIKKQLENAF